MWLTMEQYEAITRSLSGKRLGGERRQNARVGLSAKVNTRIRIGGVLSPFLVARVRDISAGGIGLMMPMVDPDTEIVIYLPRGKAVLIVLLYTVSTVRKMNDTYYVGAKFLRNLGCAKRAKAATDDQKGAA